MDFDDSQLKAKFVAYYKAEYVESEVESPSQLCAIEKMWDYLDETTKKFMYESLITGKAKDEKAVSENAEYLTKEFGMSVHQLMGYTGAKLSEANSTALLHCQKL